MSHTAPSYPESAYSDADTATWQAWDRDHIWHPYSSMLIQAEIFPVASANGVRLTLADGRELVDGMSSWWSAIHGYNHPTLNAAAQQQLGDMSHVMFGGLSHQPAAALGLAVPPSARGARLRRLARRPSAAAAAAAAAA